ncbi:MAG: undecaprenyl-phosphate glucose phosphotransferase [Phycisphaeraceae bacterium]|nr:undecaprenyl-phosphate glucose phosphotransferase [Phycisphaeraceae bacterium]
MVKQQHQLFVALLVAVDGLVASCACFIAWLVRHWIVPPDRWPRNWESYPKQALVLYAVPITIMVVRAMGLYRPRRDRSLVSEAIQVVKASLVSVVVIWSVAYLFDLSVFSVPFTKPVTWMGIEFDAGRVQFATLATALPLLMAAHRVSFRAGLRVLRRRGWNLRHVAVIGTGRLGQITARTLQRNSWTGIRVAYFLSHLDQKSRDRCLDRPVLGGLDDLERVLDANKADAVYVALPSQRSNLLTNVLTRLERFPVDVRVVPDLNPRYLPQSMSVSELDGMPILSYRESPTHGIGGVSKRIVDILGSLAAMLLFSPVMLLIAIIVRLNGPGPVIFKQRRMTLGGETFKIYKFRTMYHVEDEAGRPVKTPAEWTERNDPRITPIGRWLRRTSLDELPQFLNVLKGDMSLVGPRPERPELIMRFRDDWRGYMLRQHVKAGITGWAQVNGLRGQTSLRKRLQYDLFYVRHWSLGFDLRILVLTLFRGFVHKNAH